MLNKDGILLIDNVLWKGKVIPGSTTTTIEEATGEVTVSTTPDKKTQTLIDFNEFVKNDRRTEKVMLPIRDGLFLVTWSDECKVGASLE